MASKSDTDSESAPDFDESWIVIDDTFDIPENDGELDESVLNPVSARARSVSNLVQRVRRLKSKRSVNRSDDQVAPRSRQSETGGRPQADNRGGVINVFRRLRSRSSTFTGGGEKRQGTQGER